MFNRVNYKENKELEYSSVQKAINILLTFIPENKPKGNLELSNMLGLNKSTVNRLIQVLVYYGLIQKDEETKKYVLGRTTALLGMAVEASQSSRLAELAKPYIGYLRDSVGESVCCEVLLSGHNKVIVGTIGPPPLSVTFGEFIPMHAGSGMKAILAFSKEELVDSLIAGELEKITENTITDPDVFKEHLKKIKQQGIAYDHGEANAEVHAVSAPILNHREKPVAAISICVPASRVYKILNDNNINLLKKTATSISERLFYNTSGKE